MREWWAVILFIGGLVVGWTNFNNRLSIIEKIQGEQNPIYLQLQKDIVEIKTTLEFIKINIDKKQ